jgi:hypothetical protein
MYAKHICNGRYCNNCKINVNIQHQCFILTEEDRSIQNKRKNSIKNTTFDKGFIFFDFECMIDEKHVPNLVVSNKLCIKSVEVWKTKLKNVECSSDCGLNDK